MQHVPRALRRAPDGSDRRAWRRLRYDLARRFLPKREVTVDSLNGLLTFSSKDGIVGKHLFAEGAWSWSMMCSVEALLVDEGLIGARDNDLLINVGANIGAVLIPLVKSGLFARGLGFEPEPSNASYLRRNVSQNSLDASVQLFEVGVSDVDAIGSFELSPTNFGDHRVSPDPSQALAEAAQGEDERGRIRVPLARLDRILDEHGLSPGPGSVLWADIQGHEGHFLRGSEQTLRLGLPLVMELWPYGLRRAGTSPDEFGGHLREAFDAFYVEQPEGWEQRPIADIDDVMATLDTPRAATDIILTRGS